MSEVRQYRSRWRLASRKPPIRIGVVLADMGSVRIAALKYLVLHLNALQRHVTFEFVPAAAEDPTLNHLRVGCHWTLEHWREANEQLRARLIDTFNARTLQYGLQEPAPEHFVVVSLASMEDGYYFMHQNTISLIALGDWRRAMAPPSLVEFILTLLIVEALETASPKLNVAPFHLGTKGCIRDFDEDVSDVRYKALNAFVCDHCRGLLRSEGKEHLADDFLALLDKKWLGTLSDAYSPARIAANLGYNLFITKGVAPTLGEILRIKLGEESAKQVIQAVFSIALAAALVLLGLKAGR